MTIEHAFDIIDVFESLQSGLANEFGDKACIYTGWVDPAVLQDIPRCGADEDADGSNRQARQLVGILVRSAVVIAYMPIPRDVGVTPRDNVINWQARIAHASEKFLAAGYGVDQT